MHTHIHVSHPLQPSVALLVMSVIELFYDVISPYSYLAFTQLSAYALLWRFTLRLQPVFQGAVMKGANNTPPATVPAKQAYMVLSDLPRLSRYHQLPLVVPSNFSTFMFHTLTTMRTLAAVQLHQPDKVHSRCTQTCAAQPLCNASRLTAVARARSPVCVASWL